VIAAAVAVVAFKTLPAMALLAGAYLVAGPAEFLARRFRRKRASRSVEETQVPGAAIPNDDAHSS